MTHPYRPFVGPEAEVLECLVRAREPLTVASVKLLLDETLSYTIISTTLMKLYERGLVSREQRGRAFLYSLVLSPERAQSQVAAQEMCRLLDSSPDHNAVLSQFVGSLDPADERLLAAILSRAGSR